MPGSGPPVAHQFDDREQQREASRLGMWTFLITEVLFFGGMFTAYSVYRLDYPEAWAAGSLHMDYWIGTINTAVLLISSLFMALAVHAAQRGRRSLQILNLALTLALGLLFLGLKFYEYFRHFREGMVPGPAFAYRGPEAQHVELFFSFYYLMTGVHALHLTIGVLVVCIMILMSLRGSFSSSQHSAVVITGLYWHFVDIVWIFLYPLFYLVASR